MVAPCCFEVKPVVKYHRTGPDRPLCKASYNCGRPLTQDERTPSPETMGLRGPGKLCRHEQLQSNNASNSSQTGEYVCLTCGSVVVLRSGLEDDLCG